ncbi:MAG TPA: glycoside hydrolase family 2 TIM barrel-domain containing protein [Anaerolineae bacterium]
MSRQVLDLSTVRWQLGRVPRQGWGKTCVDDRGQVSEWLPAAVPGDVRADLNAAGRIPPVETPEGIAAGSWVDDYDWWYRTELPAELASAPVVMLEADGIDYYSAIFLDQQPLALHAGMFARQVVPLSPAMIGPGPYELAIRVWGGGALLKNSGARRLVGGVLDRLRPSMDHFSERMAVTKAQFSFGWDFAPRLLSAGIWDGIRLVSTRGAYIEDLWAYAEPLAETGDPVPATWQLRLRLHRWDARPLRVEVTISPENFAAAGYQTFYHTLEICAEHPALCVEEYQLSLEMPFTRRWWPWDLGEPCLYRVTVCLYDDQGQLDAITRVAGARSIRREALPGGAPWRFVINGQRLFLRGANWVPADSLPGRVTVADYAGLIQQARAAGVNFLRVWGGGVREKAAFWDTCDRLGLMAWQEFPLACDFFDQYPREVSYLETLASEAEGSLRLLRGHPSLIAWCGGNEIDTAREAQPLRLLADLVAKLDPSRPWIPASPSQGDLHQWATWHGRVSWIELVQTDVPFMSEFGFQALPSAETLDEMFPEGLPASWHDPRWVRRKAQVDKLLHYAGISGLKPGQGATVTQRVQVAALQAGIEACRLRRDRCGGVAIWQWNEPWPAISWSVIDHAGRPKAAYHQLVCCFQPVLVAAEFPRRRYRSGETFVAGIWLVNDTGNSQSACQIQAEIDGQPVWQASGIELPAFAARRVGDLSVRLGASPAGLALRLLAPGQVGTQTVLATNCYDLAIPLPRRQPLPARVNRWLARRLVKTG